MSTSTALLKNREGRVVDEKFPLQQWLGGSDHSSVFLTERPGSGPQRAVIKLIPAEGLDEDAQLSRWATAAKLSHPHLIRLFECGRCAIDGTRLLYVVMEYAEENLAEILPVRSLSPEEVSQMLPPTAEGLAYLHQSDFVHGRIRPSNIMAVDNQLKISADGLSMAGKHSTPRIPSPYDAPEVPGSGLSPASDIWSLGVTLVAILTQNEPTLRSLDQRHIAVPETIPQPFSEIALHCLQVEPKRRWTAGDILSHLRIPIVQMKAPVETTIGETTIPETKTGGAKTGEAMRSQGPPPKPRPKRWIVVPIVVVALFFVAWLGSKFMARQPVLPAAETHTATPPPADARVPQSPPPFSEKEKPAQKGIGRGRVLQQVLPEVSRSSQNTIRGHLKVAVHVSVDTSGNVTQAKFDSAGPSKYFAERALAAARQWKFTPPEVDGEPAASEWILRFQFARANIHVLSAEIKP